MLVLFDNGTPRTLARYLIDHHAVTEARARGWEQFENGDLLTVAEAAGFEVLVTTDKNLRYQQNLAGNKLARCHIRKRTLEPHQAACGADCRCGQRSNTRQLRRSRDTRIEDIPSPPATTGPVRRGVLRGRGKQNYSDELSGFAPTDRKSTCAECFHRIMNAGEKRPVRADEAQIIVVRNVALRTNPFHLLPEESGEALHLCLVQSETIVHQYAEVSVSSWHLEDILLKIAGAEVCGFVEDVPLVPTGSW